MVAGKRTLFLLPEPSGALAKTAILECTHLMVSKIAVFAFASFRLVLGAGCMEDGQGGPNLGKILRGGKLNFPKLIRYTCVPRCTPRVRPYGP